MPNYIAFSAWQGFKPLAEYNSKQASHARIVVLLYIALRSNSGYFWGDVAKCAPDIPLSRGEMGRLIKDLEEVGALELTPHATIPPHIRELIEKHYPLKPAKKVWRVTGRFTIEGTTYAYEWTGDGGVVSNVQKVNILNVQNPECSLSDHNSNQQEKEKEDQASPAPLPTSKKKAKTTPTVDMRSLPEKIADHLATLPDYTLPTSEERTSGIVTSATRPLFLALAQIPRAYCGYKKGEEGWLSDVQGWLYKEGYTPRRVLEFLAWYATEKPGLSIPRKLTGWVTMTGIWEESVATSGSAPAAPPVPANAAKDNSFIHTLDTTEGY